MFLFKRKTAYEMLRSLVGSEMCIRDRVRHEHSASVNAMDPAARERQFLADQAAFERKWGGGLLAEYST